MVTNAQKGQEMNVKVLLQIDCEIFGCAHEINYQFNKSKKYLYFTSSKMNDKNNIVLDLKDKSGVILYLLIVNK